MKYIALILLLIQASLFCNAKSIDKRYGSAISDKGMVVFFRPMKLKCPNDIKGFVYDMSYVTSSDSAIVNFTIIVDNPVSVEKVSIKTDCTTVTDNSPEQIYRDVHNSSYEIRTTSRFGFQTIEQLFKCPDPIAFEITLNDHNTYLISYSSTKWKKEMSSINRIIQSIKL